MTTCLACGAHAVEPFLDLGRTALANKFLTAEELAQPEAKYPLRAGFCHRCTHVQLVELVSPREMFTDYLYVSAASQTLKAHLYSLSDVVVERQSLGAGDLVVDIGCNDGTLLAGFGRHGVRTLGVDPAENLAALTEHAAVERYVGFFTAEAAREIVRKWGPAAAITATNTFPHLPELADFLEGVKTLLAPGGVLVLEMHYLQDLIDQRAFDTIYHEHVSYWALRPMTMLFARNGMTIIDAERLPVHHGQLRVFARRSGEGEAGRRVDQVLDQEAARGLGEFATFQAFAREAMRITRELKRQLTELVSDGRRVAGYGAPAKGNTLLAFADVDAGIVEYIADRSRLKQGRYTPGTHIPVVAPERLLEDQPDYVLLLAWNFVQEIMEQQVEYRRRGGRFIVPVPEVEIMA